MKRELIVFKDPKSPISEIFRTLRTNIQFTNTKKNLTTVLVTSTYANEGKTWVSANLAVTFAQAGKKVLLIDADMRKGRQFTIFRVAQKPGLSNYLSGITLNEDDKNSEDIIDYIQETEVNKLYILTAGNIPPNPSELLISAQMVNLIDEVKEIFDIVIIDGTPIQLVTDSLIIAKMVDSTIVVTACEETKREDLKRVITNIKNVGGKISGVILNKVPVSAKKYEEKYYYSASSKDKKGKDKQPGSNNPWRDPDIDEIFPVRNIKENDTNIPKKVRENRKPKEDYRPQRSRNRHINTNLEQDKQEEIKNDDVEIVQEVTPELMDRATQRTNDILKQINDYLDKQGK